MFQQVKSVSNYLIYNTDTAANGKGMLQGRDMRSK